VRWFRWLKGEEAQAPEQAAAPPAEPEEPPEAQTRAEAKTPRRRRGTRGGRGRKKKTTEKTTQASAAEVEKEAEKPKPRRRTAAVKKPPALPRVKKELLISVEVGEQRVAVVEDGKPAEVYLERRGHRSIAGNIYKGVVDNVLPGMEASFVDIGTEKNGFLYVDEVVVPELEGKGQRRIQDLLERGQEVLVQAVKDPMGTKGARLTTEVSLPGRFIVLTPFGEGIGVSRRLEDAERERLKAICQELELPEGGIIVRTAAEGASAEEVRGDLALLRKLWSTIQGRASRAEAPALVYQEAELPIRIVRDLFRRDFEGAVVDHHRTYHRVIGYLKRTSPDLAERVRLDDAVEPLMERSGVDDAIRSTLDRRVDLPSGGYLVFDYAEALTVIDVNTGRFVGGRGKAGGAKLEDTITKNNLEAVAEVVRQLRLRDVGGIIVIDFIDMANPKNRQLVEGALKRELERDRTKTYVVEISPLGLVEMTRQNVTDGPREILTAACPICHGNGIVLSAETHAVDAERRLRALVRSSKSEAFLVELNSQVAGILIGPAGSRLDELEKETGRRFAFDTRDELPPEHFAVLAEGSAAEIEPRALPVAAGDELEVKLEELHLHHDSDAVARLDGYVIAVAGASDKLGKKVKVRIRRATRTAAYAVLADARPVERPVDAVPVDEEADEKPKKKTRRGTRGGRGRKKKSETGESGEATQPAEASEATEAVEPPVESAAAEVGEDEAELPEQEPEGEDKPRKKTRRGTRGGRRRKKAEPAGDAEAVPADAAEGG
jgi:ribonuclease G